jgi:hypothetical protein
MQNRYLTDQQKLLEQLKKDRLQKVQQFKDQQPNGTDEGSNGSNESIPEDTHQKSTPSSPETSTKSPQENPYGKTPVRISQETPAIRVSQENQYSKTPISASQTRPVENPYAKTPVRTSQESPYSKTPTMLQPKTPNYGDVQSFKQRTKADTLPAEVSPAVVTTHARSSTESAAAHQYGKTPTMSAIKPKEFTLAAFIAQGTVSLFLFWKLCAF